MRLRLLRTRARRILAATPMPPATDTPPPGDPQCTATTSRGHRCKLASLAGTSRCATHAGTP